MQTIDDTIDVFIETVQSVGLEPPAAPVERAELDALVAGIAPLRLPHSVRRWWERVDPSTVRVLPHPRFRGCGLVHSLWLSRQKLAATPAPRLFLDVAYESHWTMSVELDDDDEVGGALFDWSVSSPDPFTRAFNDLQDWLLFQCELLVAGAFDRHEHDDSRVYLREQDERGMSRRPPVRPHPVHGDVVTIGSDRSQWPAHWRRPSPKVQRD